MNTIFSILNQTATKIELLNSTVFARKLVSTHVLIETARITASAKGLNAYGLNSTLFTNFLNSKLFSAVYSGEATLIFRSQLKSMQIIDATEPVIVAVVAGDSVFSPTVSPTLDVQFDSIPRSKAAKNSLDTSLVAGVLAGLIGLLCVATPIVVYFRRESKKKHQELKDQPIIRENLSSSFDSNANNSLSLPHIDSSETSETKKENKVSNDPLRASRSPSIGGESIRSSRFRKDKADHFISHSLIPATATSDDLEGPGKPPNFSSYYDLCGEVSRQDAVHSETIHLPNKFDDDFDDDMFAYADMREKSVTHFDNPLKYSLLSTSNARSSMVTKKEREALSSPFGISDVYPHSYDRESSQEIEDDRKFSKFLVQYNALSLEEMLVNNSASLADTTLAETGGDPTKFGTGKFEIVESVGDLFKAYKNNSNISIFDIYPHKNTPQRPATVEVSHPSSDPVHLRRALAASASSDSHESGANVAPEGFIPHSQRFKAIKMKFETMIQKNTKTLLLTPKESKNRMLILSSDRDVFSV